MTEIETLREELAEAKKRFETAEQSVEQYRQEFPKNEMVPVEMHA